MRKTLALLVLFVAGVSVNAQPYPEFILTPPNPTDVDFIRVGIIDDCISSAHTAVIVGNDVIITVPRLDPPYPPCALPPPIYRNIDLGQLTAGEYTITVRIVDSSGDLLLTRVTQFVVVSGHIPALDPRSLGILAVALAFAAVFVMRRV